MGSRTNAMRKRRKEEKKKKETERKKKKKESRKINLTKVELGASAMIV